MSKKNKKNPIADLLGGFTKMSDNILLDKINEQAKISTERWQKIESNLKQFEDILTNSSATKTEILLINTIMLIIEQFKPVGDTGENVKQLQSEIDNLLGAFFPGGKKK